MTYRAKKSFSRAQCTSWGTAAGTAIENLLSNLIFNIYPTYYTFVSESWNSKFSGGVSVLNTPRENTDIATTNSRENRTHESRHSIKARKGEQAYSCLENEIEYLSNRSTKMGSEKGTKQNHSVCTVLTFEMCLNYSYYKIFGGVPY